MSERKPLKLIASPLAVLAMGGTLAAGCGEGEGIFGGDCTTIEARVNAVTQGAQALLALSELLRTDVTTACAELADVEAPARPTDADVTRICQMAVTRLDTAFAASATVEVLVVPPVCTVNANAQLTCEADCYLDAEVQCDEGDVEVRCDPGELSVQCDGLCEVNAVCEGNVDLAVACEGVCEGVCQGSCTGSCTGTCTGTCDGTCSATAANGECEGTCDGTCSGSCDATCEGSCDASCSGECRGSCTIEADGGIQCSGGATCKGGCDGTFREPSCEATLEPPSCDGSVQADCSADCEGSSSFDAECTEAEVQVVGDIDIDVQADIEAALPAILVALGRAGDAAELASSYSVDAVAVGASALNCIVDIGSDIVLAFRTQVDATLQAAASVNVSVEASINVSASATATAG